MSQSPSHSYYPWNLKCHGDSTSVVTCRKIYLELKECSDHVISLIPTNITKASQFSEDRKGRNEEKDLMFREKKRYIKKKQVMRRDGIREKR